MTGTPQPQPQLQPPPQSQATPATLAPGVSPDTSLTPTGAEPEELSLYGKSIKVVADSTKATWAQQLANDETVKKLVELRTGNLLSPAAFELLLRKFQDGNASTAGLDGKISKQDLAFVASTIEEMKAKMKPEEVVQQVDRALMMGGVAKLRSMKESNQLMEVKSLAQVPVDRARSVMLAFAGNKGEIEKLQPQATPATTPAPVVTTPVTTPNSGTVPPQSQSPTPVPGTDAWAMNAPIKPPTATGPSMALVPTGKNNAVGNPIYSLQLYENGKLVGQFKTVSGRANTQTLDRLKSGNLSPLPDGDYQITPQVVDSPNPEVGTGANGRRWFIPIQSGTQGRRSDLGIHIDPSYEKSNGEDGTHGCIGLSNRADGDKVRDWILRNKPTVLKVDIK